MSEFYERQQSLEENLNKYDINEIREWVIIW